MSRKKQYAAFTGDSMANRRSRKGQGTGGLGFGGRLRILRTEHNGQE
jgi:hypothetical protein